MADYTLEQIADFIGPIKAWPGQILACYMKSEYNYEDRFSLCLFNWTNGFNNHRFLEYAIANGKVHGDSAIRHIQGIIAILEQREKNLDKWYSFSIEENRWTYLNGRTKYYTHSSH